MTEVTGRLGMEGICFSIVWILQLYRQQHAWWRETPGAPVISVTAKDVHSSQPVKLLDILAVTIKQKEITGIQVGKEVMLSVFVDDIILFIRVLKPPIKRLLLEK